MPADVFLLLRYIKSRIFLLNDSKGETVFGVVDYLYSLVFAAIAPIYFFINDYSAVYSIVARIKLKK